jgi:hypothetical protein
MSASPRALAVELPEVAAVLQRLPEPSLHPAKVQALWEATLERRAAQRRLLPRYWLPTFISAAATAALLVWSIAEHPVRPISTAQLEARAGQPPLLKAGRVRGAPSTQLARLSTPHATLAWTDARFLLEVTTGGTVLSVESGSVVWRSGSKTLQVSKGQTVRSSEPSDLAEQNALFESGRYEEYLQRFPDGALAPEASFALIEALVQQHRNAEALEAVQRHEARFGSAFAKQVHALRLSLERRP